MRFKEGVVYYENGQLPVSGNIEKATENYYRKRK
jgi:hypothetical protein